LDAREVGGVELNAARALVVEADWQYALDALELVAIAFQGDSKVGVFAELRLREKQMATTWSARQDMRIRYVEPADVPSPSAVASLEDYRDL
jgi:hypothetical protein